VGSFQGFMHYLPATGDGFAAQTWLKDQSGKEIHIGQYWGHKEQQWVKVDQVQGVPNNNIGLYPDLKDWDNDGDLDLIIGGRRGNIGLRINEGTPQDPQFSAKPQFLEADGKPITLASQVSTDFVDLDGDGLRDLVCAQTNGEISWYRNGGDETKPSFQKSQRIASEGDDRPSGYPRVNSVDMNGDGKTDLLIGGKTPGGEPGFWVYYQE
jgi:hypothetical protein